MAIPDHAPDAHARPPDSLKAYFKRWQKADRREIEQSNDIVDALNAANSTSEGVSDRDHDSDDVLCEKDRPEIVEVEGCPGLLLFPGLLSPTKQIWLLDRLLHRDLSNPQHLTNVHLFHDVQYPEPTSPKTPASFFSMNCTTALQPKDPSTHKSMSIDQMLRRKLRWMTLGGQYDWTNKVYPDEIPPEFPPDISHLLKSRFPEVDAQAAIVNLYTPGDTLAMHRDVSEECDRGLISISSGCDALFVVSNDDSAAPATIRLRSGDAVLMSGASRYAWHGVPKILAETCPEYLSDWPGEKYRDWRGWMKSKRINLNVRQMKE